MTAARRTGRKMSGGHISAVEENNDRPASRMAKHGRAKEEKAARNLLYALKYKQRECEHCKHRSARRGNCRVCGGKMKTRKI